MFIASFIVLINVNHYHVGVVENHYKQYILFKKRTYISPESQIVNLEPLQMLADSLRIGITDSGDGIDDANQIRSNKFEWEDRDYWADK